MLDLLRGQAELLADSGKGTLHLLVRIISVTTRGGDLFQLLPHRRELLTQLPSGSIRHIQLAGCQVTQVCAQFLYRVVRSLGGFHHVIHSLSCGSHGFFCRHRGQAHSLHDRLQGVQLIVGVGRRIRQNINSLGRLGGSRVNPARSSYRVFDLLPRFLQVARSTLAFLTSSTQLGNEFLIVVAALGNNAVKILHAQASSGELSFQHFVGV